MRKKKKKGGGEGVEKSRYLKTKKTKETRNTNRGGGRGRANGERKPCVLYKPNGPKLEIKVPSKIQ